MRVFELVPTCVWCVALVLLLGGCQGSDDKLVQVTGTVLVDGEPADGVSLLFFPQAAQSMTVASAFTDAEGKYTVISDMQPGIAPGTYKITATWPDPAVKSAPVVIGQEPRDAPDLLKGRYATQDRSPLSVEVSTATKELPTFELKSR